MGVEGSDDLAWGGRPIRSFRFVFLRDIASGEMRAVQST